MGEGFINRKLFFLINSQAGGGKAAQWWRAALPLLEQQGFDFFWQYSAGGVETARQVRRAVLEKGATVVLAAGGDGHLHDVLNGLIENDQLLRPDLALGVYPAGSGCDFARMIYLHTGDRQQEGWLKLLKQGRLRSLDVGRAAFSRPDGAPAAAYFLNGVDIGLGAATCLRVNAQDRRVKRLLQGQMAFLLATLQALAAYDYTPTRIVADGEELSGLYLIAAAGNGVFMGGNMRLFPAAQPDDGLLDLLLVRKLPKLQVLRLFAKVYDGTVREVAEVDYRQVRSVTFLPAAPLPLELDGELPGLTPLTVRLLPRLLPVLVFDE